MWFEDVTLQNSLFRIEVNFYTLERKPYNFTFEVFGIAEEIESMEIYTKENCSI